MVTWTADAEKGAAKARARAEKRAGYLRHLDQFTEALKSYLETAMTKLAQAHAEKAKQRERSTQRLSTSYWMRRK